MPLLKSGQMCPNVGLFAVSLDPLAKGFECYSKSLLTQLTYLQHMSTRYRYRASVTLHLSCLGGRISHTVSLQT